MKKVKENNEISNKKKYVFIVTGICISIIIVVVGIIVYYNFIDDGCENITNQNVINRDFTTDTIVKKPIIYLYPEQESEVSVKLGNEDSLLYSYPKYQEEWKVIAKTNGDLIDTKTGRNLYALYWEGIRTENTEMKEDGFVVKGEDTVEFLEEKLEILGLTQREAEEFIIYWLPQMEGNNYNYIRFETMEEIERNMPLIINPNPDTVIRIMMEFKSLDTEIKVKEQKLFTPERKGFVVVEWGGTELK